LEVVVMDRVFISVCGVDAVRGATTIEADEAAVFRAMARRARQVVVVSDSSKVGMVSPAVICSAVDIDVLITDDGISPEAMQLFTESGVKIVVV
jgi:DeoR family transcriptional regulator of aga operon